MHDKPVALITGANKGIGLQIAKDLARQGVTVLLGARRLDAAEAVVKGVAEDARAVEIDVRRGTTIRAAAAWVESEFGRLDILVNNAGISHVGDPAMSMQDVVAAGLLTNASLDDLRAVFETNVFGLIAVTQAFLPLLRQAPAGRIVNLSSESASLTLNADPTAFTRAIAGVYSTSKTAVNAVTQAFAISLESTPIKVNAVCPGFTATAINNFAGTGSVEDAAREPVRLALLDEDGPTGGFFRAGETLPW